MVNNTFTIVKIVIFFALVAIITGLDIYLYLCPTDIASKIYTMIPTTISIVAFGYFGYQQTVK